MKKIITLVVAIILAIVTVIPVMAAEKEIQAVFEKDLSVCEEGRLSVYRKDIRDNTKGGGSDCDCVSFHVCTQLYHVLEDTKYDDFYSAFFNDRISMYSPIENVYIDCSSSMDETFSYEKSIIMNNLSDFFNEREIEIKDVFRNEKTNLYGLMREFDTVYVPTIFGTMQAISAPNDLPIIITDLWDTGNEDIENFLFDGSIVFCVPYAHTNKEGVLHCEEFVNDMLWKHFFVPGAMSIYIVYTDEVIVKYSNGFFNGEEGYIKIFVP